MLKDSACDIFSNAVQQHTEDVVGKITWFLIEIYFCFPWLKNFENLLEFDKATTVGLLALILLQHSVLGIMYFVAR